MTNPVVKHLEHHGVKGMKWGVRRKVGKNGRVSKKGSVDYRTTKPLRKKKAKDLSNMQLKKVTERMKLEQKFSEMNPRPAKKGKEFMDEVLKATAGAAGSALVVKLATDSAMRASVAKGAQAVYGHAANIVLKPGTIAKAFG